MLPVGRGHYCQWSPWQLQMTVPPGDTMFFRLTLGGHSAQNYTLSGARGGGGGGARSPSPAPA